MWQLRLTDLSIPQRYTPRPKRDCGRPDDCESPSTRGSIRGNLQSALTAAVVALRQEEEKVSEHEHGNLYPSRDTLSLAHAVVVPHTAFAGMPVDEQSVMSSVFIGLHENTPKRALVSPEAIHQAKSL